MKNFKTYLTGRMYKIISPVFFILMLLLFAFGFQQCSDICTDSRSIIYYEPVYTSVADLRAAIKNTPTVREIVNPGKLYYLNGYIFINQPNEGLHVINNMNPQSPVYTSFIEIPGNFDLAGSGNYLFVDSYIDLVVLDVSDLQNVQETARVKNYFPDYNSYGYYYDADKGVVTDWLEVERIDEFKSDCNGGGYYLNEWGWGVYRGGIAMDVAMSSPQVSVASSSPGIGGSLAGFTISGNRLYTISNADLSTVNISSPTSPLVELKMNIGWGLETVFPYGDLLFIGANNGMHILDISNPLNPQVLSTYSHVLSCDPVVVQGDYAYVTLRDGTTCRNGGNLLEVVDISDPSSPTLVSSSPMFNPGGLGVDGTTLFVSDGSAGLKIFNATDLQNITNNLIKAYPDIIAIDVIPFNSVLMVIAKDGFYQFDYSDPTAISLLSTIDITLNL